MAALNIVSLDTATPQLEVPQVGDTYNAPRALAIAPETLTGSAATTSLNVTQTWNTTGTPTALKLNVTDTASNAASLLMDLQRGGVSRFSVSKMSGGQSVQFDSAGQLIVSGIGGGGLKWDGNNGFDLGTGSGWINIPSTWYLAWRSSTAISAAVDLSLLRDAANTLAQRNGTNAQAFRLYETFTDASNYSRLDVYFDAGSLFFGFNATKAGTGTQRGLGFSTGGNLRWSIGATTGHLLTGADNAYDIGASGATRPRNIFAGSNITCDGGLSAGAGQAIGFNGRAKFTSASTSVIALLNAAENDFGRLQFGGTTSSFPAIKRNATGLDIRLADDTAFAPLAAAAITANAGTAIPAGGTQGAGLKVSSTADFGVFFGSGAPTLTAAKGSLYLRSDGSTTNDRMYVNTDGSTTWTAVTTAA